LASAACHQSWTTLAFFAEAVHQVDTVLHPDTDDQRDRDQVGKIEPQVEEPHQPRSPGHTQAEREHRQQRIPHPAQGKEGHEHDSNERVQPSLDIPLFHRPDRLVANHWRASHVRIDLAQLANELLQRFTVPDILLGVDLQEELLPVLADEAVFQLGWYVSQSNRPRRANVVTQQGPFVLEVEEQGLLKTLQRGLDLGLRQRLQSLDGCQQALARFAQFALRGLFLRIPLVVLLTDFQLELVEGALEVLHIHRSGRGERRRQVVQQRLQRAHQFQPFLLLLRNQRGNALHRFHRRQGFQRSGLA